MKRGCPLTRQERKEEKRGEESKRDEKDKEKILILIPGKKSKNKEYKISK